MTTWLEFRSEPTAEPELEVKPTEFTLIEIICSEGCKPLLAWPEDVEDAKFWHLKLHDDGDSE